MSRTAESRAAGAAPPVRRNFIFVGLTKAVEMVTALAWTAMIARQLGPAGFGDYILLWTVLTMAMTVPEMGLNSVLIREISRDRQSAPRHLAAGIRVRSRLALLALALVAGAVALAGPAGPPHVRLLAFAGGAVWIVGRLAVVTSGAVFFAFERLEYDLLVTVVYSALTLSLLAVSRVLGAGLPGVMAAFGAAAAAAGALAWVVQVRRFVRAAPRAEPERVTALLRASLGLGGARMVRMLGNRVDTLILAWLRARSEVGLYSGSYGLVLRLLNVPFLLVRPIFPRLVRLVDRNVAGPALRNVVEEAFAILLLLGALLAAALGALAGPIVRIIFGTGFEGAVPALAWVAWSMAFSFPMVILSYVLIALDRQALLMRTVAVGIGLNIVLDLLLIPRLGVLGACYATLAAEACMAVCLAGSLRHVLPPRRILARSARVALAAAVVAAVGFVTRGLPPVLRTTAVALALPTAPLLLRCVTRHGLRNVAQALREAGPDRSDAATPPTAE